MFVTMGLSNGTEGRLADAENGEGMFGNGILSFIPRRSVLKH